MIHDKDNVISVNTVHVSVEFIHSLDFHPVNMLCWELGEDKSEPVAVFEFY